jgi:hypothetical protein
VLGLVVGHASSLSIASLSLGAKGVAVPRCATGAFTILPNLSTDGNNDVVSVTVGQIPAACATGTLQLTVNNGTANSSGSAAVPAGGGSLTITLATPVAANDADQIDISLNGP